MSKIAIIGATGRAGSQLLEEALRRGHTVTAIARNTDTLATRWRRAQALPSSKSMRWMPKRCNRPSAATMW